MRKLVICGLEYRVIFATAKEVPDLAENEGLAVVSKNIIYVRSNMPPSRMRDTLLHEVMHVFLSASGLGHFLQGSLREGADYEAFEETFIRLVTPGVICLLDDNGSALIDVPAQKASPTTSAPRKAKKASKR